MRTRLLTVAMSTLLLLPSAAASTLIDQLPACWQTCIEKLGQRCDLTDIHCTSPPFLPHAMSNGYLSISLILALKSPLEAPVFHPAANAQIQASAIPPHLPPTFQPSSPASAKHATRNTTPSFSLRRYRLYEQRAVERNTGYRMRL